MSLAAPTAALLLLSACAGESTYAGLGSYEASHRAQDAMRIEVRTKGSGLYGHRMDYLRVVQSRTPDGIDSWVGVFADRTSGKRVCVWVWTLEEGPLRETLTYYADACPRRLRKPEGTV